MRGGFAKRQLDVAASRLRASGRSALRAHPPPAPPWKGGSRALRTPAPASAVVPAMTLRIAEFLVGLVLAAMTLRDVFDTVVVPG